MAGNRILYTYALFLAFILFVLFDLYLFHLLLIFLIILPLVSLLAALPMRKNLRYALEIEDDIMQKVRYLDKLIDELAKGKAMEKILRK